MKKLLILLLTISSHSYSQSGNYCFEFREDRARTGWDIVPEAGKVTFYSGKDSEIITLQTKDTTRIFYVKSKLMFLKQDSLLYQLEEDNGQESRARIIIMATLSNLDFYFYSDRKQERYYRLRLKKCE